MVQYRENSNAGLFAEKLIGTSAARQRVEEDIVCAAGSEAKVLITGESGVGKEVVARLIHERSARRQRTFVALNCAGLPDTLLESELFGHERGSFTGADRHRLGMLEVANHGTLMLDEVGEMSMRMQALLLRFLETGEIQRLGSQSIDQKLDVRVLAATNRDLRRRVEEGEFRRDLYYRLNVIHIDVPALRERREDIPALLTHFLESQGRGHGRRPPEIEPDALTRLTEYDWPGNIRELRNVAERLVVRATGQRTLTVADLPSELQPSPVPPPTRSGSSSDASPCPLAEILLGRMVDDGESFWRVVHEPLMSRDLTRATVREVITRGLERTRGSYRSLVQLFNMRADDYKRFLGTLRKLDCHVAFQPFRSTDATHPADSSPTTKKS